MPENTALWLPAKGASFAVGPAPYTAAGEGQLVVRNQAVAINPIDGLLQTVGDIIFPWLKYPAVLGTDCAGEVVEVGPGVTRFRVGDRVLGQAVGAEKTRNTSAEGAFQLYTVLLENMTSAIPDALAFEDAAVLPLGVSTAAAALFQPDFLALAPPIARPQPRGETVVVWGGATSVGRNAIQLAAAAGYDVVATASSSAFDDLRALGAREVVDRRGKDAPAAVAAALAGRRLAGAFAVGESSADRCVEVAGACEGRRFVAMATPPGSFAGVPAGRGRLASLAPAIVRYLLGNAALARQAKRAGATTRFVNASSIHANPVGAMTYADFLPQALAEGRYRATPPPDVAGHGLQALPQAVERLRRGVSSRKLVVTL